MQLKDYITLCNFLCGCISIYFAIGGNGVWASLFIFFGYIFDTFDGLVARLTKTYNKFGEELDNLSDLFTYSIAPSFVVYISFSRIEMFTELGIWGKVIAGALGCSLSVCGTIRHARFLTKKPYFPRFYVGLPRPWSGLATIGLLYSHIFQFEIVQIFAIVFILFVSIMNISTFPYIGRHHGKKLIPFWIVLYTMALLTWAFGLIFGLFLNFGVEFFFDGLFFWLAPYIFFQWIGISKNDWEKYREYIKEWKKGEFE